MRELYPKMSMKVWLVWMVLFSVVYFAPAVIVLCQDRMVGHRKQHWLLLTTVFSWLGFLAYLTATDRDFYD